VTLSDVLLDRAVVLQAPEFLTAHARDMICADSRGDPIAEEQLQEQRAPERLA
jgi:hypothetical protein